MAKFSSTKKRSTRVKNHEGADAFSMTPEMELYSLVCTTVLDNQFYRSSMDTMSRMRELIKKVSPEFVGKLAVYARESMYLRTVPLVLAVELAKLSSTNGLVSTVTERVIQRADELYEILACYKSLNGREELKPVAKQIRKGIASAFGKFDAYQFAKYDRDYEITLRDALRICRPKPKDEAQSELFKGIKEGTLETPYTWETELSKSDGKSKKEKWESLIDSKKVGYMALMRNLRNILDAGVSDKHIEQVCSYLSNEDAVAKSRQFPFRFLSAFRILEQNKSDNAELVLEALEEAAKMSISNVKLIAEGRNVIACDVSGSMQDTISERSSVELYDIGLLLGQLLKLKTKRSIIGIFGDDWKVKRFSSKQPLANTMRLHDIEGDVGYSTNGWKVIDYLIREDVKADRVFFFSDGQLWNDMGMGSGYSRSPSGGEFHEYWKKYKKISPKSEAYFFDLAGYGTTPLSIMDGDVYFISGWSDKIFDMLAALREGSDAVKEIKKIVL